MYENKKPKAILKSQGSMLKDSKSILHQNHVTFDFESTKEETRKPYISFRH
jgi:hypothetical protein